MKDFRLSAKPATPTAEIQRPPRDVFRRFFDLIEKLERPHREAHPPAPEVKARISRLDNAPRRHS